MKIRHLVLLLLLPLAEILKGQAVLQIEKPHHRFERVEESPEGLSHTFRFTNRGDAPLVILGVSSSCGCTTSHYTRRPLAAGEVGEITITYQSEGRVGRFLKHLQVRNNGTPREVTLTLEGEVTPTPEHRAKYYPHAVGNLQIQSLIIPFLEIVQGATSQREVALYNGGDTPLSPQVKELPPHLTYTVEPTSIPPHEEGKLVVTYRANRVGTWGVQRDTVQLTLSAEEHLPLVVSATLVEDFSSLTPQEREQAPRLRLENHRIPINATTHEGRITLTNEGKSPLLLRRIIAPKGVKVTEPKNAIAPHQSMQLKVKVVGEVKEQRITLITNDPQTPTHVVRLGRE